MMAFETVEKDRNSAAWDILKKFGETIGRAEENAAKKTSSPAERKLTAARVSLEYAVISTARERGVGTEVVAAALEGASVGQQAMMIKEGRAALGRAYNIEPEVLVSALAGKVVSMDMPQGLGSTPALDKMVDTARNLVIGIVQDEYQNRGRFNAGNGVNDGYVTLKSDSANAPYKTELATRLAFMESTIDAAAAKGVIGKESAQMLKERIESQVFQPRPPQSIKFSQEFRAYFDSRGASMRTEAMKEVRGVTQSSTVQDIAKKLAIVMPRTDAQRAAADPRHDTKALER